MTYETDHQTPKGTKAILKAAGNAALDVGRVGAAAIPLIGGSIVETIGVLESRRAKRLERFRDRLIHSLGTRIKEVESRLSDDAFADLIDESIDKVVRTRHDRHIDLIAGVVADAILNPNQGMKMEQHHLLLRTVADLMPAHFVLLLEIGTIRNISAVIIGPRPVVGHGRTVRSLAMSDPEIANMISPLLADLAAAGLTQLREGEQEMIGGSGKHFRKKPDSVELTEYGKWVLDRLAELTETLPALEASPK